VNPAFFVAGIFQNAQKKTFKAFFWRLIFLINWIQEINLQQGFFRPKTLLFLGYCRKNNFKHLKIRHLENVCYGF